MAPVETVVCGVDDSREARLALRAAHALAGRLGARLVVVHAPPDPAVPGVSAAPDGVRRVAAAEEEDARALVGGLLAEIDVRDAEIRVAFGSTPGRALVAVADEEAAGLVVVGARGRGALASAVLGSVSSDVVAHAHCPVLIVPGDDGELGLLGG